VRAASLDDMFDGHTLLPENAFDRVRDEPPVPIARGEDAQVSRHDQRFAVERPSDALLLGRTDSYGQSRPSGILTCQYFTR
jgi:hypothetical protein